MKKSFRKILLMLIILGSISISLFACKTEAATLNMSYGKSNSSTEENNKEVQIKPGEEIIVNVSIVSDDNNSPKIMSIYGNLEFDNNVLELIKSEDNEKSAQIELGDGWIIGNLNMEDSKFLIYTSDKDRSDTAFSVKFKVKEDCKVDNTTVVIKDIILYNASQKAIEENVQNINLEIKIDKIDERVMSIGKIGLIIVILIIIIACIFLLKKKSKKKNVSKSEQKESEISEKENNINTPKNEEIKKDIKNDNKLEKDENKKAEKNKDNKEVDKTSKNKDDKKENKDNKENKKSNNNSKNDKKTEKAPKKEVNKKTEKNLENKKDEKKEKSKENEKDNK